MTEAMARVGRAIAREMHRSGDFGLDGDTAFDQRPDEFLALARAAVKALEDEAPDRVFWQNWAAKRVEITRSQWLKAGKSALKGDMRDLRLRVELAEAPPVPIVLSDAALAEGEKG